MLKRVAVFLAVSFIFCFFSSGVLFAQRTYSEPAVTAVERSGGKANVVFNGEIKIFNIIAENGDIKFPVYANQGRLYRQFGILNGDFKKRLYAVLTSTASETLAPSGSKILSFTINKREIIQNHQSVRAYYSVIFDGVIEVYCRIMEGKDDLWIAWPSSKNQNGRWNKDFEFKNAGLKRTIESALINDYNINKKNERKSKDR